MCMDKELNHLKKELEDAGIFQVTVATAPLHDSDFSSFKPEFSKRKITPPMGSSPWPTGKKPWNIGWLPPMRSPEESHKSTKPAGIADPLSAARMLPAEFQFAGQNEPLRATIAEAHLRRLPIVLPVENRVATASPPSIGLFSAPPALVPTVNPENEQFRTADRDVIQPSLR